MSNNGYDLKGDSDSHCENLIAFVTAEDTDIVRRSSSVSVLLWHLQHHGYFRPFGRGTLK